MKGDFTRFTYRPEKHYTRVLKQQGRVDLDADWNESVEIFTYLERTEAIDVIGRCGVPEHSDGFKVDRTDDGSNLTISRGRIYVDGILCSNEAEDDENPIPITEQTEDLPGYSPALDDDGVYLTYLDVWERHITCLEDPDIREVALGGPDTTTRTRTICQVKLEPLGLDAPLDTLECRPFVGLPATGRLAAQTKTTEEPSNPCVVPAAAGYRGLENRLYRVEIHDDGRDGDGTPTFKWSRDNGSVVLPIAENGIDGDVVTLKRLGPDEVLTVKVGHWVEILGDETELHGRPGTLAQIEPDGIDKANLEITLSDDVSAHKGEGHLKMRRWDHHATDDVALQGAALPIQGDWFELEDGVRVRFDMAGTYHSGDYWVIPARTRQGTVLWPQEDGGPAELGRFGIEHHYCTLALARRQGGSWTEVHECRPLFRPLTDIRGGACCVTVEAGDDVQQAIDSVIGAGGGCVKLCPGVHEVAGPLWIRNADDVKLIGVNTSSVLRFDGVDALGRGGLIIERGQRVAVGDLFICSDNVPALISVLHDEQETLSRQIAFRSLTMLNLTRSDGETNLACGIRLGHSEGVDIDRCRIAAEVGIASLWGNALPDLSALSGDDSGAAGDVVSIAFETLPADTELRVGESITAAGIPISGEAFQWPDARWTESGYARVDDQQRAGGAGHDLMVNNINLNFQITGPFASARVAFGSFGGNTNLRVNGELRNVNDIFSLDGEVVGGVRVSVARSGSTRQGLVSLDAQSSPIGEFIIGGQELWIDNVTFRGSAQPSQPVWSYGDGVSELLMRLTTIRYTDYGLLIARAERWAIADSDVRSLDADAWSDVLDMLPAAGTSTGYTGVLGALEATFDTVPAMPTGTAVLAFLWRDSTIEDCELLGFEGVQVFWWIRGAVVRSSVTATDLGLYALWLHDANWVRNRVDCADGTALGFTGSYRARVEHNRVTGLLGLSTFPFTTGLASLGEIGNALLRGYGGDDSEAGISAFWIFTEESVQLMGLRELMDALGGALDIVGDVPVTFWVALILMRLIGSQQQPGSALVVIDLRVVENRFVCRQRCIALDEYFPLGSLRIADNSVHSITGQAIRVEGLRWFANAHLAVFLYRAMFALLLRQIDEALEDAQGAMANLLEVLRVLVSGWQAASESFLDLDFRIEGNSIRSLRTAIESNLYELAILNNHITLQERATRRPPAVGTVFGSMTTPQGDAIAEAFVRVLGTERAATADENGEYRMVGLPAGTYTLQAAQVGFATATAEVTVAGGEQVEVNFELAPIEFVVMFARRYERLPLSSTVLAERVMTRVAPNPEIAQVISALERSEAFEPLGVALREGGHTSHEAYSAYLLGPGGPLTTAEGRSAAADSAAVVGSVTSDPDLEATSGELNTALRNNDMTALAILVPRFIAALHGYIDSLGILARGVGCRIVENQVLVPADINPETQALGGIQISVDYLELAVMVVIGNLVMRSMGQLEDEPDAITDPLLNITETLVQNNEVTGGVGHGVSVQGVAGQPDYLQDLRITGNQLRGLAGSGIFCNEHAFIIGLHTEGNEVSECGRVHGFTDAKGGILVRSAAVCTFKGNRIARCGAGQTEHGVFGVDLDTVYGLHFVDNELLSNGSDEASADDGGLQLVEVYGNVVLHDNVFSFNSGSGLSWANSAQPGEAGLLPQILMDGLNRYLRTTREADELVQEEQASVQGNVFKADGSDLPVFSLMNLNAMSFLGNNCLATTSGVPMGEIKRIVRGAVANNLLQTNAEIAIAIKKLGEGVVVGNVGNRPIQLQLSPVQTGFNVPAAV